MFKPAEEILSGPGDVAISDDGYSLIWWRTEPDDGYESKYPISVYTCEGEFNIYDQDHLYCIDGRFKLLNEKVEETEETKKPDSLLSFAAALTLTVGTRLISNRKQRFVVQDIWNPDGENEKCLVYLNENNDYDVDQIYTKNSNMNYKFRVVEEWPE